MDPPEPPAQNPRGPTISNQARILTCIYEEAHDAFDKGNDETAFERFDWLLQHPQLPPLIRANCHVFLGMQKDDYLHHAEMGVMLFEQLLQEAPYQPGEAMLATAREVLQEAQEDFAKLEAKRARRRAKEARQRDNRRAAAAATAAATAAAAATSSVQASPPISEAQRLSQTAHIGSWQPVPQLPPPPQPPATQTGLVDYDSPTSDDDMRDVTQSQAPAPAVPALPPLGQGGTDPSGAQLRTPPASSPTKKDNQQ